MAEAWIEADDAAQAATLPVLANPPTAVLRAADRCMRVRLLLGDLDVRRTERALATLAQHP